MTAATQEAGPKARPILFSGPMVRALLDGRKSMTRRLVKPQPEKTLEGQPYWHIGGFRLRSEALNPLICPYGKPGDLLWVRENIDLLEAGSGPCVGQGFGFNVHYKADGCEEWCWAIKDTLPKSLGPKSNIHMHRWASRLTLELEGVRVERLQDISEKDAIAEGVWWEHNLGWTVDAESGNTDGAICEYAGLWESINGKGSWDANPWVFVLEFRVHHQNIDAFLADRRPA